MPPDGSPHGDSSGAVDPQPWSPGLRTIVGAVVALNLLTNAPLPSRYAAPLNLIGGAVVNSLALRAGVSWEEQGLERERLGRGLRTGVAFALPAAALLAIGARFRHSVHFYRKRRIVDATAGQAAYDVLFRIPFGTALCEEMIFRGALPGLIGLRHGRLTAALGSSALFGFWHILPTLKHLRQDAPSGARLTARQQASDVVLSVGVTSVAGLFLCGLRYRAGSVAAPWVLHGTVNAAGFVAGWLTHRRRTPDAGALTASSGSLRQVDRPGPVV